MLFEDGDYKIVMTDRFTRKYFEHGQWHKEEQIYDEPVQLFYLTTSRTFSLYKSQCLREGDKPLPESTVEYYLKNSAAFICETKKESFKKIDPKTGHQEENDAGQKKRTSTTALVFNMGKLGLSIGPDDSEASEATNSENPTSNEKQGDLPF